MKLNDLFPEDEAIAAQLAEVSLRQGLRRAGMAGALAANLGVAGIAGYALKHAPTLSNPAASSSQQVGAGKTTVQPTVAQKPAVTLPTRPQSTVQAKAQDTTPTTDQPRPKPRPKTDADQLHPNYPKELVGLDAAEPDVRVDAFIKFLSPYIESENRKLAALHDRVARDYYKSRHQRPISRDEGQWLGQLGDLYGTHELKELVKRVDVIPPSLALAQAAIESGWGQDPNAREGNAFYGQKSWSKTGGIEGPEGERYRAFDNAGASVAEYMFNLNTHSAYSDFRNTRYSLRRSKQELTGLALAPDLLKYSDRGKPYVKQVAQLIRSRDLDQLDKTINQK